VTAIFERLVDALEDAAPKPRVAIPRQPARVADPLAVVTGATGFLGGEIARALPRVRGIGRGGHPSAAPVAEWVSADLGAFVPPGALAGADVVVHAAAETSGGFQAHQRNTIDATRNLLRAMHAAGASRLVLVSSLSVLQPPRTPWERQHETTPRGTNPRRFGAYTWGKTLQEELVEREAPALGIDVRIVRPGALLDPLEPELPGLMGRPLLGRWHLGLGRPGLPLAVCDVRRCAEAIAWIATHFDEAPRVVNLFEPEIGTRGDVAARLREHGWRGSMVWVPIGAIAAGLTAARTLLAAASDRRLERLDAWSVLRPRRYDGRVARAVLASAAAAPCVAADDAQRLPA
jgi:nucleoside-diphosphate-sugar epimerase